MIYIGHSHDVVLHRIDLAAVPVDIVSLANFLVPIGVMLLTVSGRSTCDRIYFVC